MLSLTAKHIMTRDVVTIKKGASVEEALRLMACNRVSGLPVVDVDNRLVGIITESDLLLKGQFAPTPRDTEPPGIFAPKHGGITEAHRKAQAETVEQAMTKKVLWFEEDSLVSDIARAMVEHAVNRVPILRDGVVVGIVSRMDIIRSLAAESNGGDPCDVERSRTKVLEL